MSSISSRYITHNVFFQSSFQFYLLLIKQIYKQVHTTHLFNFFLSHFNLTILTTRKTTKTSAKYTIHMQRFLRKRSILNMHLWRLNNQLRGRASRKRLPILLLFLYYVTTNNIPNLFSLPQFTLGIKPLLKRQRQCYIRFQNTDTNVFTSLELYAIETVREYSCFIIIWNTTAPDVLILYPPQNVSITLLQKKHVPILLILPYLAASKCDFMFTKLFLNFVAPNPHDIYIRLRQLINPLAILLRQVQKYNLNEREVEYFSTVFPPTVYFSSLATAIHSS